MATHVYFGGTSVVDLECMPGWARELAQDGIAHIATRRVMKELAEGEGQYRLMPFRNRVITIFYAAREGRLTLIEVAFDYDNSEDSDS